MAQIFIAPYDGWMLLILNNRSHEHRRVLVLAGSISSYIPLEITMIYIHTFYDQRHILNVPLSSPTYRKLLVFQGT